MSGLHSCRSIIIIIIIIIVIIIIIIIVFLVYHFMTNLFNVTLVCSEATFTNMV